MDPPKNPFHDSEAGRKAYPPKNLLHDNEVGRKVYSMLPTFNKTSYFNTPGWASVNYVNGDGDLEYLVVLSVHASKNLLKSRHPELEDKCLEDFLCQSFQPCMPPCDMPRSEYCAILNETPYRMHKAKVNKYVIMTASYWREVLRQIGETFETLGPFS